MRETNLSLGLRQQDVQSLLDRGLGNSLSARKRAGFFAKLLENLEIAGREEALPIAHLTTGGGSDGNFIAHYGVATLDGCGPCGAALHTVNEYLKTESVEKRYRLMKRLIRNMSK